MTDKEYTSKLKSGDCSKDIGYLDNTISDCITDFLFYDRKEDDYLPVDRIEEMIEQGQVTIKYIMKKFLEELHKSLKKDK